MQPIGRSNCRVPDDKAGIRLDVWLAETFAELSRARIQSLIKTGAIRFADGSAVKPHTKTSVGMELVVEVPPAQAVAIEPEDIPLDVLHEDTDLVVINKSAGLVVHPAPGHADGTLVNALLFHCKDRRRWRRASPWDRAPPRPGYKRRDGGGEAAGGHGCFDAAVQGAAGRKGIRGDCAWCATSGRGAH